MKQCCGNCKYYKPLMIFRREIETMGGRGIVNGVRIILNFSKCEDSMCCTYFLDKEEGTIIETISNDWCECWEGIYESD